MPVELRPLGVGEIFDRAVTLYVRNFAAFAIMAAFVAVPVAVGRYFLTRAQEGYWAQILETIQHPQPHAQVSVMQGIGPTYALIGGELLLAGFMYTAIAVAVARLYGHGIPDWREAYKVTLQRTGAVLSAEVAQIAVFVCGIAGGIGALALMGAVSILLLRAFAPLGVLSIIITILCAIALFCVLLLSMLCISFTLSAIGVEHLRFMQAAISAYERIFNVREIWKALVICLALIAIQIAAAIAGAITGSLTIGLLHAPALEAAIAGVISLISTGFTGVLIAVYYFDVRIRGEGLDMQAELDRLELQPQA
jgi:hypothetical protein